MYGKIGADCYSKNGYAVTVLGNHQSGVRWNETKY